MDATQFSANLSERHKAELIATSAALLNYPLHVPTQRLDSFALRLHRIEPPRDRDLPVLTPQPLLRPAPQWISLARAALQAPPPTLIIGYEAALARAADALIAERPVVLSGTSGSGKTAFLRALAANPRLQAHFSVILWLDVLPDRETFARLLALALDAPHILSAAPEAQPAMLSAALQAQRAVLLCDFALPEADRAWLSALAPHTARLSAALPDPNAEQIMLGKLPSPAVRQWLAEQTPLSPAELDSLTELIDGQAALLRLCAALLAEDDLTPVQLIEILRAAPTDQRYATLLRESINTFPAEYRALCHDLAATQPLLLPSSLITERIGHPVAARRALTFLARRRLIDLHPMPEGDLCSILFRLPADQISEAAQPFSVAPRTFERFSQLDLVQDERAARAEFLHKQGIALTEENRPDEAAESLHQALTLRQALNAPYAIAETLSALGRLAYLNGDDAAAIAHLEAAAELLHKLRDVPALELLRLALCRAYARAGRLEAALSIVDDESAPPADLAALYRARGDWEKALECYERWTATTDDSEDGWLLAQIGRAETLILAGRAEEALHSAPQGSFTALWAQALICQLSGDLEGALNSYAALESVTPHAWRGTVARSAARVLAARGEVREAAMLVGAEGVWYEARQPYAAFARQRLSLALYAHFCLMLGDSDNALRAAQESRALRAERADPEAEAIACRVLGRLAWQAGDYEGAMAAFEAELKALSAPSLRDDAERAIVLHLLGDLHREQRNFERAAACYRRALSYHGTNPSERLLTLLALAECLAELGRNTESLEVGAEAVAALYPHAESADLALVGSVLAKQAQRQAAFGRPERALAIGEHWLHTLTERFEEALNHPESALNALAIGLYLRSMPNSALAEHDPIRLIDLAERALLITETRAPQTQAAWAARRDLAELYGRLGHWAESAEVLAPLLAQVRQMSVPEGETGYLALAVHKGVARAAANLGDLALAVRHYEAALPYETDEQARCLLCLEAAEACHTAGDDACAAEYYTQAAALLRRQRDAKRYAETLIALGYGRLRLKQHSAAVEAFQEALRAMERTTKPEAALMAQLYADLGAAYAALGQTRGAAGAFKQALGLIDQFSAPERYAAILTAFARSEMLLEAYQSAATAYQEVLQFDHSPAERRKLLSEQAAALSKLGQVREAIHAYEQALTLSEDAAERAALQQALGELYMLLEDFDTARAQYEAALDGAPPEQVGALWHALGELQRAEANSDAAINAYTHALLHLDARRASALRAATERAIGELYLATQRPQQAIPPLERALELEKAQPRQATGTLITLMQALAQAHEACGDLARAVAYHHSVLVYQDAHSVLDDHLATLGQLARLYMQLGRYGEVLKAAEEALRLEAPLSRPNYARLSQTYFMYGKAQHGLHQLDLAAANLRRAIKTPRPTPIQEAARQALAEVEAEIARHEQTLAAAEQSRLLLERTRLPDLKSLAFVIALQAQSNHALGRLEAAQTHLEALIALLRQRRHEMSANADPTLQTLLLLLRGAEATNAQLTAAEYRAALESLQREPHPNAALLWVVRFLLEGKKATP